MTIKIYAALATFFFFAVKPAMAAPITVTMEFPSFTAEFDGASLLTGPLSLTIETDTFTPDTDPLPERGVYLANAWLTATNLGLNNTPITSPTFLIIGKNEGSGVFIGIIDNDGMDSLLNHSTLVFSGAQIPIANLDDLSTLESLFVEFDAPFASLNTSGNGGAPIKFANGSQFDIQSTVVVSNANGSIRIVPEPATYGLALASLCLAMGRRRSA